MSSDPQNVSRRGFARAAATAALLPVVAPLAACAGGTPEPAPAPAPATAGGTPTAPSSPPQPAAARRDPVAEELTEVLRARFGDRLTTEQWDEVRRGVEGNQRLAKTLHDFEIPQATEPATVFRAVPGGAR